MKRLLMTLAVVAMPFSAGAVPLGPFSDLLVFGDSLSDPGNAFTASGGTIPPPSLYPNGQFTNGDTWATQLGADLASGQNFAFGGAKAVTDADLSPDLAAQVDGFIASALTLGPSPLAAIFIGANDLGAATTPAEAAQIIGAAVGQLTMSLDDLVAAGVSNFALLGLPNLGRFPDVVGTPLEADARNATLAFNAALQWQVAAMYPGAVYVDVFSTFEAIFAMPADYGIVNTTEQCIQNIACLLGDPNSYAFYDRVHPTEKIHTVLAEAVRATVAPAVPAPAAAILMLSAFGLLAASRRRAA